MSIDCASRGCWKERCTHTRRGREPCFCCECACDSRPGFAAHGREPGLDSSRKTSEILLKNREERILCPHQAASSWKDLSPPESIQTDHNFLKCSVDGAEKQDLWADTGETSSFQMVFSGAPRGPLGRKRLPQRGEGAAPPGNQ